MITWRIYYGDGSVYSSSDGLPESAPGLDVQAIAKSDPLVGRVILHGGEIDAGYYWYEAGEWYNGDIFGLFDYLQRPGFKVVKFGRSIPTDKFREILQLAVNDPGFPAKSAKYPNERIP